VTEIELPPRAASAPPLVLRSPDAKTHPLPAIGAKTLIGPLDTVGIWSIGEQSTEATKAGKKSEPVLQLACNLAARSESDLTVPDNWKSETASPMAAASFFVRPIWFYLAACAWLLAIGEWFLYQRRWIS
jgi:hypothetical protein